MLGTKEDFELIRQQINIEAVANHLMKKQGKNYIFPSEKSASVRIYPETQSFYDFGNKLAVRPAAVQFDGKNDVFIYIQHRNQIVILKDESDIAPAENRELFVLHREKILSSDDRASGGRPIQTADHI